MKLYEYNGVKVVTIENLEMYIANPKMIETMKNNITKWIGIGNYYKVNHPDSRKYGQKEKFNYARGINLFPIDNVKAMLNRDFFSENFDIKAFENDITNGNIRGLEEEISNNQKEKIQIPNTIETPKPVDLKVNMPTVPIDEVYAMIDRISEFYQKGNNELKDKVNELIGKVETLTNELEMKKECVSEKEVEPSILIMKDNASYEEWKKVIYRAIDIILKIKPEWNKNSVLSNAYDRLRAQYGIVWEQEAKEFKEDYGRSPVNTRELCWWMETTKPIYKNLLIGKLNTIYSEARRELA